DRWQSDGASDRLYVSPNSLDFYDRLLFLTRLSPSSTLFPYTTLFRSPQSARTRAPLFYEVFHEWNFPIVRLIPTFGSHKLSFCRSEEHTSELQSRENLVCRLLLEKKKTLMTA